MEEIRSEHATENKSSVLRRKIWVAGLVCKGCGQDTIVAHIQELVRCDINGDSKLNCLQ